jgi:hypothetical protein
MDAIRYLLSKPGLQMVLTDPVFRNMLNATTWPFTKSLRGFGKAFTIGHNIEARPYGLPIIRNRKTRLPMTMIGGDLFAGEMEFAALATLSPSSWQARGRRRRQTHLVSASLFAWE